LTKSLFQTLTKVLDNTFDQIKASRMSLRFLFHLEKYDFIYILFRR